MKWEEEDKAYLCAYYTPINCRGDVHNKPKAEDIGLAIGRSREAVAFKYRTLKKQNKVEYYKTMWEQLV